MKCQVCKHYSYTCGVSRALSLLTGKDYPTTPMNHCDYARVSWKREKSVVVKKRGMKCNFELTYMTCVNCNKPLTNRNNAYLVFSSKTYLCKKCSKNAITAKEFVNGIEKENSKIAGISDKIKFDDGEV